MNKLLTLTLGVYVALVSPWAVAVEPSEAAATKILFIGDSFTGSQGGIWTHVAKLAASVPEPIVIASDAVVVGGATLKRQWDLHDAVTAIDTNAHDVVVLQDDIPEINIDYFRQYATQFINEARLHRARPVLYMTWAYQRLGWIL
jgi:hypothetical protein